MSMFVCNTFARVCVRASACFCARVTTIFKHEIQVHVSLVYARNLVELVLHA